jgi:hypothetical protein
MSARWARSCYQRGGDEVSDASCGRQPWPSRAKRSIKKPVVQFRGTNAHAQSFYRRLGFAECGRLSRQVMIDGRYDDEILMELFL